MHSSAPHEEGCEEYINATTDGVNMVCYTRPERMLARKAELPSMLKSAWLMAEQAAPRSIADDFEHGTSTEHVHMPDTLDVEMKHYADCSARNPHTVLHYRVWPGEAGAVKWREREAK